MSATARQNRFKQVLERYGTTVTLYKRYEFNGKPEVTVSDSGGTLPAGTYYYLVTPVVGDEKPVPGPPAEAVCTTDTSKVVLSWTAVTAASGYKVYRSTDPSFPTPCLIASPTTNSLTDDGLSASAGEPPESPGTPYVYYVSSTVKALIQSARISEVELEEGLVEVERRVFLFAGDADVDYLDEIAWNNARYRISSPPQPYPMQGIAIYIKAIGERIYEGS